MELKNHFPNWSCDIRVKSKWSNVLQAEIKDLSSKLESTTLAKEKLLAQKHGKKSPNANPHTSPTFTNFKDNQKLDEGFARRNEGGVKEENTKIETLQRNLHAAQIEISDLHRQLSKSGVEVND